MKSLRTLPFATLLASLSVPGVAMATEPIASSSPTTADPSAMPAENSAAPSASPEPVAIPMPAAGQQGPV